MLGVSFFNGLRSMAGRYELVFLTASVRPLIDLTYAGLCHFGLEAPADITLC